MADREKRYEDGKLVYLGPRSGFGAHLERTDADTQRRRAERRALDYDWRDGAGLASDEEHPTCA